MASCEMGAENQKLITPVDQNMKNNIENRLELLESDCIPTQSEVNEENSEESSNFELVRGCDDRFAGFECIRHVNMRLKDYDKCYIPLDENSDSKTCGECDDPIFDKGFNHGMYLRTKLFSVPVMFLIDTGAATSILSDKVYQALPEEVRPVCRPYHRRLMGSNGREIKSKGWVSLTLNIGENPILIRFVVFRIKFR